jgi:hypothetical protein
MLGVHRGRSGASRRDPVQSHFASFLLFNEWLLS